MKLYFIRHGEMDKQGIRWLRTYQEENFLIRDAFRQGLSEKGKQQAQRVAKFLTSRNIQYIYSSPIQRAKETAQFSSDLLNLPIDIREDFKELDQGTVNCRIPFRLPLPAVFWYLLYRILWLFDKTDNLEGRSEVFPRITRSFRFLCENHHSDDGAIAIFTHGFYMWFLRFHLLKRQPTLIRGVRQIAFQNCAVMELEVGDSGKITSFKEYRSVE
jgi:broad specificity phosphatase PhoE